MSCLCSIRCCLYGGSRTVTASPATMLVRRISNLNQSPSASKKFWQWTTKDRPKWTSNAKEAFVACVIFGVTGTSSMLAVRPALKHTLGMEGSLVDGPNEYRIMSLVLVSPIYAAILLALGTLGGRHKFFAKMSMKIWGRFLPRSVVHRILCTPAKLKQGTGGK